MRDAIWVSRKRSATEVATRPFVFLCNRFRHAAPWSTPRRCVVSVGDEMTAVRRLRSTCIWRQDIQIFVLTVEKIDKPHLVDEKIVALPGVRPSAEFDIFLESPLGLFLA